MRHNFMYIACQVTGITDTEIRYTNVVGRPIEWTYEIRTEQVLDLSAIEAGKYYYIHAEDVGKRKQQYLWTQIMECTKLQAIAFHEAHTIIARESTSDDKSLYQPIPEHLIDGIMEFGPAGLNIWKLLFAETGKIPSYMDYAAEILKRKAYLAQRDQKRVELMELNKKRDELIDDLLSF